MLQLEGENYTICGESSEFTNRQKSIFDQLNAVEVKRATSEEDADSNVNVDMDINDERSVVKVKRKLNRGVDTKQYKGRDSIFKKFTDISPRSKTPIPDHQRNPHKWVKYSLSDVSQDDMSEQSNTAAAMAFLREVAARKLEKTDEVKASDDKIVFKKPIHFASRETRNKEGDNSMEDTSYFKGSKRIMPEYIIGKQKKESKRPSKDSSGAGRKNEKKIKLNHLTDFDDGDDE